MPIGRLLSTILVDHLANFEMPQNSYAAGSGNWKPWNSNGDLIGWERKEQSGKVLEKAPAKPAGEPRLF